MIESLFCILLLSTSALQDVLNNGEKQVSFVIMNKHLLLKRRTNISETMFVCCGHRYILRTISVAETTASTVPWMNFRITVIWLDRISYAMYLLCAHYTNQQLIADAGVQLLPWLTEMMVNGRDRPRTGYRLGPAIFPTHCPLGNLIQIWYQWISNSFEELIAGVCVGKLLWE